MKPILKFKLICEDVAAHLDVLIKHSENYYFLCRRIAECQGNTGDKALYLTKQAVGSEIVSRTYRLIKEDNDAWGFPLLIDMLADDNFLEEMLPSFIHDGRKSPQDLINLREEVKLRFENISRSLNFKRLVIYRARFIAHRVQEPRDIKSFPQEANVLELSSAELRWLADNLSVVMDKIQYMVDRGGFPADQIAREAQDEASALWGLPPPQLHESLSDLLNKT
jgi:hypothetical protein